MMDVPFRVVVRGQGGGAMGIGCSAHLRVVPFVIIIVAVSKAFQLVIGSVLSGGATGAGSLTRGSQPSSSDTYSQFPRL